MEIFNLNFSYILHTYHERILPPFLPARTVGHKRGSGYGLWEVTLLSWVVVVSPGLAAWAPWQPSLRTY